MKKEKKLQQHTTMTRVKNENMKMICDEDEREKQMESNYGQTQEGGGTRMKWRR